MTISARTFGVEIECHLPPGKTHGNLAEYIRRHARVSARCRNYTHETVSYWKLVQDGSLGFDRGASVEVVSPILSGEEGLLEVARVMSAIQAFGAFVSKRCGFHVHVYAGDLNLKQMQSVAINFVNCETAFDALVQPSRRGNENQFILSNRIGFGGSCENEMINRAIAAYESADSIVQLCRIAGSTNINGSYATRYRKLNFDSYHRYRTVEFRQHGGTVDALKATNWVRLCIAFVEKAMTNRLRKRQAMKSQNKSWEVKGLVDWVGVADDVRAFFKDRARILDAAALARLAARGQPVPAE